MYCRRAEALNKKARMPGKHSWEDYAMHRHLDLKHQQNLSKWQEPRGVGRGKERPGIAWMAQLSRGQPGQGAPSGLASCVHQCGHLTPEEPHCPCTDSPVICELSTAEASALSISCFMLNKRDFRLLFSSRDLSKCCLKSPYGHRQLTQPWQALQCSCQPPPWEHRGHQEAFLPTLLWPAGMG